jgi:hypothetical protein
MSLTTKLSILCLDEYEKMYRKRCDEMNLVVSRLERLGLREAMAYYPSCLLDECEAVSSYGYEITAKVCPRFVTPMLTKNATGVFSSELGN